MAQSKAAIAKALADENAKADRDQQRLDFETSVH